MVYCAFFAVKGKGSLGSHGILPPLWSPWQHPLFLWQYSSSTRGMLALLAFVSEAKADVTCDLVSQGTGCRTAWSLTSSLGLCLSSTGFWVGWDWTWGGSILLCWVTPLHIGLMDGKLALRLSYLLPPHFRVRWKLLGSNIFHRKRGQLERAERWPSIPDQAVLLSSFHVANPQILTDMLENLGIRWPHPSVPHREQDRISLRLPRQLIGEEPVCQSRSHRRCGFDPWVWKVS